MKRYAKTGIVRGVFGCLFAIMMAITGVTSPVYAEPTLENMTEVTSEEAAGVDLEAETEEIEEVTGETEETVRETTEETEEKTAKNGKSCQDSMGALGWLVCPATGKIAEAVDWLYDKIETILVINPVEMKDGAPIYEIWKYMRGVTNIGFIIFLLVMVYSQITGLGISNYGLKKTLPKLIVGAILVNLSFIICSVVVDASNIVGSGLRGIFETIEMNTVGDMSVNPVSLSQMYGALGGAAGVGVLAVALEPGEIWMLIPTVLGALAAVTVGLITIALRQAVVALLIMIAPLAVMAYILPNTEQWFRKWKDLLFKMLIFYPMFSLLFGASSLAGFAIVASAKNGFFVCLGIAVQIFPLFFSWSLMKMSGTFLSGINAKLTSLTAKPLAANRAWAESHKAQTSARYLQYGITPSSHLRRYLDNRRTLREIDTENLRGLRKNEANIYAQRKISAGYDGTKAQGTEDYLKANKYTRTAKDLSNSKLAVETATMDTGHVLSNYGSYYVDKRIREAVDAATKLKDQDALDRLMSDAEHRRATTGATNYLEYSRAKMTQANDEEADFNFMVDEYLDASLNYRPDKEDGKFSKYKHYIMSSAGGLGGRGQTRVLGKIIAQAAAVESSQRRDINIVAAKFPPDKSKFRDMLVGYYVNDDGLATDKNGKEIEKVRGSFLQHDPDKLVLWDYVDEKDGPYYDWYDTNGNYVTRIYKKDKSAIKELLSNFDTPINDPINNLYGILAGIKEGDIKGKAENLKYIGLDSYRTTVGRAILNAPFKEKNAAFSPMVAEMVGKGYIKNYSMEYLAYLDSLNKATKPGAFNVQDGDAIDMFARIMDPKQWDTIFAKDLVKDFKNVNGKPLTGIRIDEDGNTYEVPVEEATQEELMRKIKEKFLYPAARKIIVMMSRQTQNTSDNQKAGTIEKWKKLKDIFDTEWREGSGLKDPYEQAGDMRSMAWEIQDQLYIKDEHNNKISVRAQRKRGGTAEPRTRYKVGASAHHEAIDNMYVRSMNDPDGFARDFAEYCDRYPELAEANRAFRDFIIDMEARGKFPDTDALRDFADSLIDSYAND
ncbi:hypothetical protein IJJ37_01205 [Candidatus Saccharibacteria bacterium]|nr:hypothetical protein [Candidatus Saccharibacteria bacterium]